MINQSIDAMPTLSCHASHTSCHSMSTNRTITFAPDPRPRRAKRKPKAIIFRPFRYVPSHICPQNNSPMDNHSLPRPQHTIAEQNAAARAAHQRAQEWAQEMTPDEEEEMEVEWMLK